MLLDLREKVRNSKPIKYTLITIICIPFALVGVGSYLTSGGPPPVAEVNGTEITQQQLERAYTQQRRQISRMFGGQIPPALDNDQALRAQAREQLIDQQVVQSAAENEGFAIGDEVLNEVIRANPAFHLDGTFDKDTYTRTLRGAGQTPASFEHGVRVQTALSQFREGVTETAFTLPGEASRQSDLQNQTRTIDFISLGIDTLKESIEVNDEDQLAYFNENSAQYEFPERAKVQYIELDSASFADDIDISDEEAEEYYTENKARYVLPEQRDASHILLAADGESEIKAKTEEAEALKARLDAGESFADLAKEFSDDPGSADSGGSLGAITAGSMVAPFEQGVNELAAVGDISEPIVTQFGVHLIKLDRITAESGQPFEEVKAAIVELMQTNQADQEYNDLRIALEEAAFDEPDSLDAAAAATGLDVQETDWVDVESDNGEIFSNPAVLQAVFSDDVLLDGLNSEVIELSNRRIIALRVLDSEGPRPKTFEDVSEEVLGILQTERAAEQLDTLVAALQEKIVAGEDVQALADAEDVAEATIGEVLTRQVGAVDRDVVSAVYAAAKPSDGVAVVNTVTASNGDRVVYALRSVDVPEADDDAQPAAAVVNTQGGNNDFNAMVQAMRASASIELSDLADIVPGAAGGY